jgi:gentisate 1,2-dioxygenase
MAIYYDRYEKFRNNGKILPVPFVNIPVLSTDKSVVYKLTRTRLDKLSQTYYNNPYHGYLIMLANPQYGGLEFNIKDGDIIRIPYPFDSAIERYIEQINNYKALYG